MHRFGYRQVTFFAEHHAIENANEIFGTLGADDQQAFVEEKVRHAGHTTLADAGLLRQHNPPRGVIFQCAANVSCGKPVLLTDAGQHILIGNIETAFTHYSKALDINPNHRGAHEYIGEAFLDVGNLAEAKEHLAILASLCSGCEEHQDLKEEITEYMAEVLGQVYFEPLSARIRQKD